MTMETTDSPVSSNKALPEGQGIDALSAMDTLQEAPVVYPFALKQGLVVTGLLLGMFLAGLDISIISTAIPAITAEFNSLSQAGWYGSVFFLTDAAFQSVWAKAYKYFDMKHVNLVAIFVFEVGCLICALAPNSPSLIVGRAIQGSGAAGMLLGCYSITNFVVPPNRVALIVGMIGTIFSVASVIGPLLGGVLTSNLTWRWCFYINLPIGVVPFSFILIFFKTPAHAKVSQKTPLREILLSFDPIGLVLFLAALICYFLALGWGGTEKSWDSSTVIGLIVGWILLTIVFFTNEVWQGERALLVLRVMKKRGLLDNCIYLFFLYGAYFTIVYNVPIYFQATAGLSPQNSGIRTIPIILMCSIVTMASSVAVGKLGYYQPFLIVGSAISAVSGGLIYTFDVDTSLGKQIGYQTLLGTGIGLVVQIPPIVAGAMSSNDDKSIALGAVLVTQFYSACLAIAASSAITNNLLLKNLPVYTPSVNPADVLNIGPYDLQDHFSGDTLRGIREAYIVGLRGSWAMAIALWGVAFLTSFITKWPGSMIPEIEGQGEQDAKSSDSGEKVVMPVAV